MTTQQLERQDALQGLRIIDADSHVLEPPDLWERYIDPKFRDRTIKIVKNEEGRESLIVDNQVIFSDLLAALGGVEFADRSVLFEPGKFSYLDGAPPASMDHDARLKLFEDWGIQGGAAFPTIGILWDTEDPLLADAYARAYNNWLWDFSGGKTDTILPIAHIPLHDVDLALAELRRCLKMGFKGVFVAPEPEPYKNRRPSHPDFDPLWHELEDAGLPFCLHVIVRFTRPVGLGDAIRNWYPEGSLMFAFSLGATLQVVPALVAVTLDGLFDRFPRLRCFCVEAGAGWAAYIMDRIDEKHQFFAYERKLELKPSEYLRRNVWYCAEPTERTIDAMMDLVGETQLVWGSDYPHIDSHIEAAAQIRESVAGLSDQRKRLVLGENARNLFQL